MAIDNPNVIDGMAIDENRKAICLLLTDHFAWNGNDTLSEYDHLILLQEKINAYNSGFFYEKCIFKEFLS